MNSIRNLVAVAAVTVAIAFCAQSASAFAIKEPVFNPATSNHYRVLTLSAGMPQTFDYANQLAVSSGGHLVTIDSRNEEQWVLSQFDADAKGAIWTSTGTMIGATLGSPGVELRIVMEFEHLDVVRIGVNPANGHEYRMLSPSSWLQASVEASFVGAHLVTFEEAGEAQYVLDTFSDGNTRSLWIGIQNRTIGAMPRYGSPVYGVIELDPSAPGGAVSLTPVDAGTLGATGHVDLFSNGGTDVTPVAKDAPTATRKASWGTLKALYR